MRNPRLRKRLGRLEAGIIGRMGWNVSFVEVQQATLAKLSSADRDLINEVFARNPVGFAEAYRDTWNRFEVALKEAIHETGFPIFIRAEDWFI
jgi:hypothetical protein